MSEPAAVIPAVRGLPVLGSTWQLLRDPLRFVCSLPARGDVVTIKLGPLTAHVINDPGLIREMLVNQAHAFDKGRQFEKLRPWWGNGLPNSEGAFHLRQRRLMQPAFHRQQVARYLQNMQKSAAERISTWPDGQVLRLDQELYALTITMVAQNLFSASVDDESIVTLREALSTILDGVLWRCLDTTDRLEKLPTRSNRRFNAALATMHTMIDDIIDRHHADQRADGSDLLSMLRQARDPGTGQGMSSQQIHDEVISILMTGSETTRTTLSWVCYLLSRNPAVQRRMQAEIDQALAGGPLLAEHLETLTYTRRVITETLRMYPPVWLLTRRATTDVFLGPYRIPAGSAVCFSAYALHRNPGLYPHPDQFTPDRWSPGHSDDLPRGAYLPFGTGNRGCIGEPVAWAQATTILAAIAQRWTLAPAPQADIRPEARMLLMPGRLPLIPQARRPAPPPPFAGGLG